MLGLVINACRSRALRNFVRAERFFLCGLLRPFRALFPFSIERVLRLSGENSFKT